MVNGTISLIDYHSDSDLLSMSPHAASPRERAAVAPPNRRNVEEFDRSQRGHQGSLFSDFSDVLLLHLEANTANTPCAYIYIYIYIHI